jgi:hypothetical protein
LEQPEKIRQLRETYKAALLKRQPSDDHDSGVEDFYREGASRTAGRSSNRGIGLPVPIVPIVY